MFTEKDRKNPVFFCVYYELRNCFGYGNMICKCNFFPVSDTEKGMIVEIGEA